MARRSSNRNTTNTTDSKSTDFSAVDSITESIVESIVEETAEESHPEPKVAEVKVSSEEGTLAPAASPDQIHAQIKEKLSNRLNEEDAFIPSNPANLEKVAAQIAEEKGFVLNRGTSVGARLMARAQKRF